MAKSFAENQPKKDLIEKFNDFTFKAQVVAALGLAAVGANALALLAGFGAAVDKVGGNIYENFKNNRRQAAAKRSGSLAVRAATA